MKAHVVLCQEALEVLKAHFLLAGNGSLLQCVDVANLVASKFWRRYGRRINIQSNCLSKYLCILCSILFWVELMLGLTLWLQWTTSGKYNLTSEPRDTIDIPNSILQQWWPILWSIYSVIFHDSIHNISGLYTVCNVSFWDLWL